MMNTDENFVQARIEQSIAAKTRLLQTSCPEIQSTGKVLVNALKFGNKVLFCGNGGSAADSQHLAAELICKLRQPRRPLPGLALTTDTSVLTAVGNDFGFRDIFARQVEALGAQGDVLICISTSGKSENLLAAVAAARNANLVTIGLLGKDGGPLAAVVDHAVIVREDDTQRIQECQILIGHIWMEMIENELFG